MAEKVEFSYFNGRTKMVSEATAKALQRIRRGTYLTRDMQAQPVGTASSERPEVDAAGEPWNPDLHVATKRQNNDGTWRRKPGAAAEE